LKAVVRETEEKHFPLIQVSPENGKFLQLLVRMINAKNVLEVGTLTGYSAIWMARGLGEDGKLKTLEINPKHAEVARAYFKRAGLEKKAEVIVGDGLKLMDKLSSEKFDFIFIDAGHDVYSVFHDFSYSCLLLSEEGEILMDDFAPTEPFGLGTCIVAAHATRVFEQVEAIESNGIIFEPDYAGFTRGMVHLAGMKRGRLELDPVSLLAVRVLGKAVEGLFHPKVLPIRIS
jgi:hypothetical protein